MALLETPKLQAEPFHAPDFSLQATDGRTYRWADVRGAKATLILFICNHCPYVVAVIDRLVADCRTLLREGVGIAAIMPNDTARYPADSFDRMKEFAAAHDFPFPYLIDETQQVARAYGAVCTPDIFGFDADDILRYRGRVDSAGPHPATPDTKREMLAALRAIAAGHDAPAAQHPSMGCSIKWRE